MCQVFLLFFLPRVYNFQDSRRSFFLPSPDSFSNSTLKTEDSTRAHTHTHTRARVSAPASRVGLAYINFKPCPINQNAVRFQSPKQNIFSRIRCVFAATERERRGREKCQNEKMIFIFFRLFAFRFSKEIHEKKEASEKNKKSRRSDRESLCRGRVSITRRGASSSQTSRQRSGSMRPTQDHGGG
jgi:hypothetical protein